MNNWEVRLNKTHIIIKNGNFEKEYKLLLYMKGKDIAGVGETPDKSYDKKYSVFELVDGEDTFRILQVFLTGCFKDFQSKHVKGFLNSIVKPHVTFIYSKELHERFLGLEKGFLREAIELAGSREVHLIIE